MFAILLINKIFIMKNLKKVSMFLIVVFLTLGLATSCSNDDDDSSGSNSSGEFVSVKIDGSAWSSSSSYDLVSASKGGGSLSVQGSDATGNAVRFTITSYSGTGTYTAGDLVTNTNSLSYITISPIATWTSSMDIGSGTMEITSDSNGIVEGTFSFEGYNADDQTTKSFTVGKFRANVD